MISIQSKLPGMGTTVFSVMTKLAEEHNAINLSQGFPDFDCAPELIDAVNEAMNAGMNQYAPMAGLIGLRELVVEKVRTLYNASYDIEREIVITAGGTQAIFTALCASINPGDEVIIFEPAYDAYAPIVKLLGGLVKPFELSPPTYEIDWEMVKKLFSANTRMIILNSPQNPTGRALTTQDIQALIKLTKDSDVLILSDEVYEHMVFDGKRHESVSRYPELRERSFIVASFGKLLHATGWKMGYCLAPEQLMREFKKVHQFNVFSVNTPMQAGVERYLRDPDTYLGLNDFFQKKRDLFRSMLTQTKFNLLPCDGSYFQCVSYAGISEECDTTIAERLTTAVGVASIPVSAFYTKRTDHQILRFCFAKKNETLERAVERLIKF